MVVLVALLQAPCALERRTLRCWHHKAPGHPLRAGFELALELLFRGKTPERVRLRDDVRAARAGQESVRSDPSWPRAIHHGHQLQQETDDEEEGQVLGAAIGVAIGGRRFLSLDSMLAHFCSLLDNTPCAPWLARHDSQHSIA
jgi:hypothetical protein